MTVAYFIKSYQFHISTRFSVSTDLAVVSTYSAFTGIVRISGLDIDN